jgi:predicted ATPase/class 3 adenylate cyclase
MPGLPSGTVTFLFTDLEGSTRLWEQHPDAMREALARHDAILVAAIEAQSGVVYSKMGDGMAAVFGSPRDAVRAAIQVQLELAAEPWPEAVEVLRSRMGIHTGEGVLVEDQYLNQPLNRCARVMAIGHGGQVLLSGATEPLVRGDLPADVELADLGEHRLRDLSSPLRIFQARHSDLPGTFPPLRSLNAFPGNLPLQTTSFIGRTRDLARVGKAIRERRVVTLTGVGGVGKSRLALQAAADGMPGFRDGAWLVELGSVRHPDGVLDAAASIFGVGARTGQSVQQVLIDFLRTKQLLLVVDNCEHVLEVVGDLIEMLEQSCSGLVFLATSREGLGLDGEHIFSIPPLAVPVTDADLDAIANHDAVSLFVERARGVDADFVLTAISATAVAQVCRRLDGVPLAIELAAAQVSAMSPAELAQRIDHRFETLTGGRRRSVERHQTLRAAIDWSYDLCTEPERRLLARMAVFVGGHTRESAEIVCSDEDIVKRDELFTALRGLVAKSLVVAERDGPETRYGLLGTIREYAEERLAEHGEVAALRARHAECYAELARQVSQDLVGSRQVEAGKRLELERENLVTAMNYAITSDDVDLALRLLFHTPSAFQVGYVLRLPVDPILELSGATEHRMYPYALATIAYRAAELGDLETTESRCAQAMAAIERLGAEPDRIAELTVATARGIVARSLGTYDVAVTEFLRAAEIARSVGRLGVAGALLSSASDASTNAGDADAAITIATEGLALARQAGLPTAITLNLTALAGALTDQDPIRAQALLRESRELRATFDYEGWVELHRAVVVSACLGEWPQVLELAPGSMRHLHWIANWALLATVVNLVARAVAPASAETAATLQGIAERLSNATHSAQATGTVDGPGRPAGNARIVAELQRTTTELIERALGADRLRELRADGAALDDDAAVAYAIAEIDRLRAHISS